MKDAILIPLILFVGGLALAAVVLGGCSRFGVWSPSVSADVSQLCVVTGDVLPALEAIAAEYTVPLEYVQKAYQLICGNAPKGADAVQEGLRGAHAAAAAARLEHMRVDSDDAGAP